MRRAALDSNVIVSGTILSAGAPAEVLAAWRARHFELVTSPATLGEIGRVLRLPKISRAYSLEEHDVTDLLQLLETRAIITPGRLVIPRTARDPDDDQILASALEGHADYIVTGDQDLLALEHYQGIPIVTPAVFAGILRAAR